jgi:hypothetical protein
MELLAATARVAACLLAPLTVDSMLRYFRKRNKYQRMKISSGYKSRRGVEALMF